MNKNGTEKEMTQKKAGKGKQMDNRRNKQKRKRWMKTQAYPLLHVNGLNIPIKECARMNILKRI